MEEIKLWRLATGSAREISSIDATETEHFLETVLENSPELMSPGLTVLGRQLSTPGGPLDLLGLDDQGKLVIFELKRGTLTRDAVAQVFDYTSFLASLDPDQLTSFLSPQIAASFTDEHGDFRSWFSTEWTGKIGSILVGLGVDERAKRMVTYLRDSGVDIELITFYGFAQDGQTLLARQVEVKGKDEAATVKTGKVANLARLTQSIERLGLKSFYEKYAEAVKAGMGLSAYTYPYPVGYTYNLPGASSTGGQTQLAYIALYVNEKTPGKIRVNLQPRAITCLGREYVEEFATSMGSELKVTPAGYGNILFDPNRGDFVPQFQSFATRINECWLKAKGQEEKDLETSTEREEQ